MCQPQSRCLDILDRNRFGSWSSGKIGRVERRIGQSHTLGEGDRATPPRLVLSFLTPLMLRPLWGCLSG